MSSKRVPDLIARLEKGRAKTREILNGLKDEEWGTVVYDEPRPWDVRNLIAYFLSTEEEFLRAGEAALAGVGSTYADFDYNFFNAREQKRLQDHESAQLMAGLDRARQATIDWVEQLKDEELEITGTHPALGEITMEALIIAVYAHQLLHMREVLPKLR